jgi:hypothetical protein
MPPDWKLRNSSCNILRADTWGNTQTDEILKRSILNLNSSILVHVLNSLKK